MASDSTDRPVFVLGTIQLIHAHLTDVLCEEVFHQERDKERQRKWSLHAMAQFWAEVIIRAPESLTIALEECSTTGAGFPHVEASPEAFFQKSANMHPRFFARVFERFHDSILPEARPVFASEFSHLDDRFPHIWAIDGSKLSAVWHRLKKLWPVKNVILPGAMLGLYDLRLGILQHLHYSIDAARAESHRALEALQRVPEGTLILGDRLFAVLKIFNAVADRKAWILAKRNKTVKFRRKRLLRKGKHNGGTFKEYEVEVGGTNKKTPAQTWRYIKWTKGRKTYELVTNILDPNMLSAEEAIDLYKGRWTIERMFYDLKEVLNLNNVYASNPYAVAQQVYACALVHTAMRISQGHIAEDLDIEPELLSVPKLFPRLASASVKLIHTTIGVQAVIELNPDKELLLPDLNKMDFAYVPLKSILREKRCEKRRKKKFNKARKKWNGYKSVPGMKRIAKN